VTYTRVRQPRIGTRKLHYRLAQPFREARIKFGRDALFEVLRNARLLVKPPCVYHKTTHSHHRFRKHPNLLKDGPAQVVPTAAEQVWVADVTYLPTALQCVCVSLVTDVWSRRVVGYHVHDSLQTEQVAQALKMALRGRTTRQPLIHHSDRGVQYCSTYYQQLHARHGLTCSMTDGYDCYQNALAERVNGILKNKLLLQRPDDLRQAIQMVRQSVEIYNNERAHTSLNYRAPDGVHRENLSEICSM
jgi:putative transposase